VTIVIEVKYGTENICNPSHVRVRFFVRGSKGGFGVITKQLNDGVTGGLAGTRVPDTIIKEEQI
jgi:hypothetical protein